MGIMNKNNVYSLSGGKDSTAMLLMAIEREEPIHSVVFFDTGWEFPQMHDHIDLLEKRTGIKIWRLQSRLPFDYWMAARPIIARKGAMKGKVHRIGNGWPSPSRRWCTREKTQTIDCFQKPIPDSVMCVGYAADETHRGIPNRPYLFRFPLFEWNITEADALRYCYDKGYDWGGLYEDFDRVSCFCCPLQSLKDLKTLRKKYPELWQKMLGMEMTIPDNRGFRNYDTVHDLEKRFAGEDRQGNLL